MLINRLIIVGGGTAGWLTAAILAAECRKRAEPYVEVTLIESPDTSPIGVGEGTWPTMRDTLRRIGVSETAFFRECDASFKQGSRFDGWVDGSAGDSYYHPFVLPHGYNDAKLVEAWCQQTPGRPFAEVVSFQPHLCARGKAPKQFSTPEYAAVANYAYHLDAGKFAAFLCKHCTSTLGVRHIRDHVVTVNSRENGDVAALITKASGTLEGDLFIDCTGLPALLIGQHFGVPFRTQRHVLFNDRALALQVPHPTASTPLASQTISTAQPSGWIWDIALPARRGIGYVYSSAHADEETVERELLRYVERTGGRHLSGTPRRLRFEPGFRERFWHRNCVAIGLSGGFIEPLEASAIALIELSAGMLADQLPTTHELMDTLARRFNETFTYRWERVIDFLKLHYALTKRRDSVYWRDHVATSSIPDRLAELLMLWRHLPPSRYDLARIEEIFPSASYQYVLYGMGFKPSTQSCRISSAQTELALRYFRETAAMASKMIAGLPSNNELIDHVQRNGLTKI